MRNHKIAYSNGPHGELYEDTMRDYGSNGTLNGWEKFLGRCEAEWHRAVQKATSAGAAIWS